MQNTDKKKRQMARMSWKFFHSTVCMLVFSVVVHATMPSGIHPIIAFLRQLNHVVKSKSLRGWQIYIINSQPFYIEGFMVSSITNLIRTANHTNAMVQTANLTCLASIVMSSMRHGLIASKKAMMGCLPDGMVASDTTLNDNMHTVLREIFHCWKNHECNHK